ncbi:MAG: thiosulfate oxidation carrier protein SoxY [Rhodocyclaceae bacterium]|nr:thiosulfate oxidation carrier protein SoxY [Rhodocyclaceae bacterium]
MTDRRRFLAASALTLLAAWAARPAAARQESAFQARNLEAAMKALQLPAPVTSGDILIDAPELAENGANVPVEVTVNLPKVERLLVLGDRNLFPLLADITVAPRTRPWFEMKVKLAETSNIRVLALADGRLYQARRQVRVILGGCLPG